MIEVTRFDGSKAWLNPHQIEQIEASPDTTLLLLSGKHLLVRESAQEIVDRIVAYRRRIGSFSNED
jgi:flagellar protein FlbD